MICNLIPLSQVLELLDFCFFLLSFTQGSGHNTPFLRLNHPSPNPFLHLCASLTLTLFLAVAQPSAALSHRPSSAS